MSEVALVKTERMDLAERPSPREIITAATEEANVLAEVIESRNLYSIIQGRKFVKVEGWTTLATLRGCLPREVSVTEMGAGRYVAEVELVRMSDGLVLTRASAECGGPEDPVWEKRPPNARRSMAITRATGKACRVAFSWVMSLAGFEVTPAEEMDHVGTVQPTQAHRPAPQTVAAEPIWRGRLAKVEAKSGTTGGKPWSLWTYHGSDGERFGTFDTKIAEGLERMLNHGFTEIVYEINERKNKTIVEWRDVTAEEAPFGN